MLPEASRVGHALRTTAKREAGSGLALALLAVLVLGAGISTPTHAANPEPDAIYYGLLSVAGEAQGASSGRVVEVRRGIATLSRYVMGELPAARDLYVLRIAIESAGDGPVPSAAARIGDVATILVDSINVGQVHIASRGRVTRMDLVGYGSEDAVPDTDDDGFPDFLDVCSISASQADSDGNGIGDACEDSLNPGLRYSEVSHGNGAGDPNVAHPTTGLGAVDYRFRIGNTEVTNADYMGLLNAVAATDPAGLYNEAMAADPRGGIVRQGKSGGFVYSVKPNMANKPVNFVSWLDAARFANWLENDKPSGPQDESTTEAGAFDLTIEDAAGSATLQEEATSSLPTEDEWYKAAYYDPSIESYWAYPTISDSPPFVATANSLGDVQNPGPEVANHDSGASWGGQTGNVTSALSAQAPSPSGTFDQGGNVAEWLANDAEDGMRIARGGSFLDSHLALHAEDADSPDRSAVLRDAFYEGSDVGFRVLSVPEPRAVVLALAALLTLATLRSGRLRNRPLAVILAGCAAVALAAGRADAQPVPESVTVSLVEGWNLVGWTGDDTPILSATADIAFRFDDLRAFDPESGAMLRFRDGIAPDQNTLTELRYGMGVWVLVSESIAWAHAPRAPSTTVALRPGFNLVAWLGEDDTSTAAALAPLGAAVLTAHTWDRVGQRFRRHRDTGETAFLNESTNLMRGDALWLEMAAAADWAQQLPGADAVGALADADGTSLNHADGASVDVPPGALPVGTPMSLFRIETPPNLPGHIDWVGPTYEISAGAILDGFATLRVPVPDGVDPADLELFRFGASNLPIPQGAVLENGKLVAQTAAFSVTILGKSKNLVRIDGPQLVFSGATVQYVIGDAALAGVQFVAQWEFESAPEDDIFAVTTGRSSSLATLVAFKAGATGSGTIRVKVSAPGFTASGQLAVEATTIGPTIQIGGVGGRTELVGEPVFLSVTASGGTRPHDFEIDFDEGDPPVTCPGCASPVTLSNRYEKPGLKTVVATVTDAKGRFATTRSSVVVVPNHIECDATARYRVRLGRQALLEVAISGGEPGYSVDWSLSSSSNTMRPDPNFDRENGRGEKVIRTYKWSPEGAGTYRFVAVVSDALGTECRSSFEVRVPPLGLSLNDPPVGVQKGDPFRIAGTLTGAGFPCVIRLIGHDGNAIGLGEIESSEFVFDGVELDDPGTHELTVRADCDLSSNHVSVTHQVQVLDNEAMWVRGSPIANPDDLPLLTSDSLGGYEGCLIFLPDGIGYIQVTRILDQEEPTADMEFLFAFAPPPRQIAPGTKLDLDLFGAVTGFHDGVRNRELRLQYAGTFIAMVAVVRINGLALSESPPAGVLKADEATATAEFPAFGGATGFLDISVHGGAFGSACRVRWPYVRVSASN